MFVWFGMECLAMIKPSESIVRIRKVSFIVFLTALGVLYAFRIMQMI
jgi:hypothetical protein